MKPPMDTDKHGFMRHKPLQFTRSQIPIRVHPWLLLFVLAVSVLQLNASTFTIGDKDFLLDGKPFLIKAGEMHPSRVPHEYWADRLRMMHAMGLNTVSIYVFWNEHEPREGRIQFHRRRGHRAVCAARAEGRFVGDFAARSVLLRGMGIRRLSVVAAQAA